MSVGWVAAGATLAAGAMSADAAGDAADAQAAGAAASDATQRYMYNTTREDNAPFRDAGVDATNRLQYLLGLSSTSGANAGGQGRAGSFAGERLVDTSSGAPKYNVSLYNNNPAYRAAWDEVAAAHYAKYGMDYNGFSDSSEIERSVRARLPNQIEQDEQIARDAAQNDPAYGSLLRNFTKADFEADPVIQLGMDYGLSEGTKGLNRLAAANGSLNSGATLKALTRFGNDYASTKGNESFNRFNTNKQNTYNMLSGLSGGGQVATNQISSAGQNMANQISQNQIGMGNARAASSIGRANAWGDAIGTGINTWQQNRLMNQPGGYSDEMSRIRGQL